jgi:predicted nucleic-acid-binding protein
MLAIDTNILVRVLTDDDPRQSPRAAAILRENEVFVSATVLLEAEWVLRDAYGLPNAIVVEQLRRFIRVSSVRVEDRDAIHRALDWAEAGMDFADALHLARVERCEAFVTFDRDLARAAKRLSTTPVRLG